MADYDFDNPAYDPHDIDDVDDDSLTPFTGEVNPNNDVAASGQGISLEQELIQTAVDDYYNSMAEHGWTPALGRDTTKFELGRDGKLRLKDNPDISITNSRTRKPLALSTIAGKKGGTAAIRELGFVDWKRTDRKLPNLPTQAVNTLQAASRGLVNAEVGLASESMELRDLQAAEQSATEATQVTETALGDPNVSEILKTIDDPPLTLRELRGLDQALQTIRGELTNNLAKLSALDEDIAKENEKLAQADDDPRISKDLINQRLQTLKDERAARVEAAAANREALRSQVNRIRETINRILNEDTTLAERIRTLFREQGITIASIVTAIGMAISTLVVALTGGGTPPPPPAPPAPSDKGGIKEWLKKHLQSLGRVLAKLAGKAGAALPGIIGSIVSWLLNLLSKTAGWLAQNVWPMILTTGSLLFFAAYEWLRGEHPKKE